MSKLQSILKALQYVPKKTFVVFGLIAAVLVPAAIWAWGPERATFTMEVPATYVTFNSITNNTSVGDERNFTRIRETGSSVWGDKVTVQEGKEYTIRMYVHNNAAANLNLVATNVRASLNLPLNNYTTNFTANGFISADNAKPNKVWDQVIVNSDKEFRLQVVSAKYFNNVTGNTNGWDLGSDLFTANGAQLGYTSLNGKIPGCMQYAGYIIVKVKPQFKEVPKHPSYDVIKTVNKTKANPSDTIEYTILAKNTGDQDLTNVVIKDSLPSQIASASVNVTSKNAHSGDIFNGGLVLSKLEVGETATIKITAKIKGAEALVCGENKLVNTVTSTSDQDKTEDRTDNNSATTTVDKDCPVETPEFDLVKSVDKTSAKPGDTLNYTLVFKNTGKTDLTNVVIKDILPSGVELTGETKANVDNGSGISDLDKLFSTGVKVAKVNKGGKVTITFSAKVKLDKLVCGENKLVNKSSSTTKEKTDESDLTNNETTTKVDVDCEAKFDLVKSVDKTSAKPGDTLNYTLVFKNTGKTDLTNVVIKDILPSGVELTGETKANVDNGSGISDLDKLFSTGVKVAKVNKGGKVTITFSAKIADKDAMVCGTTKLKNVGVSSSSELVTEPDTSNNTTETTVEKECNPAPKPCPTNPSIPVDDENCRPCEYDSSMNYDNPNCVPPVSPVVPTTPLTPATPTTIVATGPTETMAAVIGTGALAFGTVAYTRSRKVAKESKAKLFKK